MAKQQFYRPDRQSSRNDGVYDDESLPGNTPKTDSAAATNARAKDALDDIDSVLADNDAFQKSLDSEQLEEAEGNPSDENSQGADDKEESFFNSSEDKAPLRQRVVSAITPKKAIAGGVAGLITIGVFATLSISSGPLQFIHLAQLMERFHFASLQDNGDSRMVKLYKWAKNAREGSVENSRLGVLEKKIAVKADERLSEIGIKKNYADTFGAQYEGISVNQEEFTNNAQTGEEFRNLDKEEFKVKFKEKFNVQLIDAPDGSLIAPSDEIGGFFRNRTFNSVLVEEAGYGKVTGAVTARIMGKRDAVTWHPIKKLEAKAVGTLDERFTAWLKSLKDYITNGDTSLDATAHGTKESDGSTSANPEGEAAAGDLNQIADDSEHILEDTAGKDTSAVSEGFIKQFTDSTTGKAALGATAVIGLTCAVKALGDNIDNLRHDMVVLPLIRTGVQAMSLGGQAMNGTDMNLEQLGFFAKELNDPKSGSWASARSIQAELGQQPTGKDIPKSASIRELNDHTFFDGVLGDILGSAPVGVVCDVADSIFGQALNIAIGVVTAPFATGIGFAIAQTDTAKDAIAGLVQWLAGSPIPTMVFGPDYGNYVNYGARLAANDSQLALGGVKLTGTQSAALKQNRLAWQRQQFSEESFAQRVLDPYSPDSLVGKVIDSHTGNTTTNVASMFSGLLNPSKALGMFGSIFSGHSKVAAATTYDYGFPEMGFSLDDLEAPAYENPYDNANSAISALSGANGDTYITRAKDCFGVTLSKTGDVTSDFGSKIDPLKSDYPANCTDPGPEWTSVRFFILDTKTAEAADCFGSSDAKSCADVGFGNSASTTTATASSTLDPSLPTGTQSELLQKVLASGKVTFDPGINLDGVKATTLAVLLKLTEKYSFQVSSALRPGCGCPHGDGSAIDINGLNGVHYPNDYGYWSADFQQFENDIAAIVPSGSWLGEPNQTYVDKVLEIGKPRGVDAGVDPGSGAHFHFNVPSSAP